MWKLVDKVFALIPRAYRAYKNSYIFSKRRIVVFVFMFCFSVFYFTTPIKLSAVLHKSVKYNLAFWLEDTEAWEKSEYIMYLWKGQDPFEQGITDGMMLTKRVGCRPGQKLEVKNEVEFYCDEHNIGSAYRGIVSRDKSVTPFKYNGIIPNDKIFLIGDSLKSYDSRYFGLVDIKQVVGKVIGGL